MYTTDYKKGDKIKARDGSIFQYVGIDRFIKRKSFIYLPIKTIINFSVCDPEWEKKYKYPKGSVPFSQKLEGEKI